MAVNSVNSELFHKLGKSSDGQCLYEVKDKESQQYKKFIVPENHADTFEKLNNGIEKSLGSITSESFKQNTLISGLFGAASGVGLSLYLTRKATALKKIFGMAGAATLLGTAGAMTYMLYTTFKVLDYGNKLKALNVRPYDEQQDKNISFTGAIIEPASPKEVKELANIFYSTFKHNVAPNKKEFKLFEKIDRYLSTKPFIKIAELSNVLTETAKIDEKIAGGYSMTVMPDKTAHLNFITLSPELVRTKTGISVLKDIGKRIFDTAVINDVEVITYTTNTKNKPINSLLERFSPVKIRDIAFGESEYAIPLQKIEEVLNKLQ